MRVIHSLGWYYPESSGGTEVYVESLTRSLAQQDVTSIVCAPNTLPGSRTYQHHGIQVFRYPVPKLMTAQQIRGELPHGEFEVFENWLSNQQADIYHQHSWTTGCGLHHLKSAKDRGYKTVLTVHVPGNICLRGTMMLFGEKACDGLVSPGRCGACRLQAKGVPVPLAKMVASLPVKLGRSISSRFENSLCSMLSSTYLVEQHQDRLAEMIACSDRVVAVCDWLRNALMINGVPEEKLIMSRQGVDDSYLSYPLHKSREDCVLRVGFLGRWTKVKGLHLLMQAIQSLPEDTPIELVIYGMAHTNEDHDYKRRVLANIEGDSRIRLENPVPRDKVPEILISMDVLAVPSQWLETGPLVVLEAQALGLPVLGSSIGGIAELVQDGTNGRLVKQQTPEAWAEALLNWIDNPLVLERTKLRNHVRTMRSAALEMEMLYGSI